MKVSLVSYTKPVIDGVNTPEDLIAFCARVSNPSNQLNMDTGNKLISYLIKNSHWSPLELVDMTVEIECTRDIGRQILRHWSFSFQEFSQRYADPTKSLDFEIREARLQDTKNRQASITTTDEALHAEWTRLQQEHINTAKETYKWAIDHGIAKEVARAVLPEGNTMTRMYMKGSVRDWIHYCQLRATAEHGTQKEHQLVAQECLKLLTQVVPAIVGIVT